MVTYRGTSNPINNHSSSYHTRRRLSFLPRVFLARHLLWRCGCLSVYVSVTLMYCAHTIKSIIKRPSPDCKTRRRHPIPQSSPVVDFQPPRCPHITPSYCRGTLVCFSWSETLEQSSGRYYYGTITTSVSKKTENLPISAIIPGHYTVISDCFAIVVLAVTSYFRPP